MPRQAPSRQVLLVLVRGSVPEVLSVVKKHDMDLLQQSGTIFEYGAQVVSLSSWRTKEGLGAVQKSSRQGGTRRGQR